MKRVLRFIVAAALATTVGMYVASAGAAGAPIATFSDSVGEIAGAPDVGKVTVSLDGQVLTVTAEVAGLPQALSEGMSSFALNTDGNRATGSVLGADYVIGIDYKTLEGFVLHWNGSDYVAADKVADPALSIISGGTVGFQFNLANLGSPKHVEFAVLVSKGPTDNGLIDVAPDAGLWAFDTTAAPTPPPTPPPTPAPVVVKPVFGAFSTVPAKPVAGKKLVYTLAVNRSDTGAPLTTGRMICDPSVGGVVIKHAESFTGGTAKLTFTVPKTAKGKALKVKVTIVNGAQSATKIVSLRVR